ncbi:hypothetical protein GCM10022226_62570 [Sphaerisporangium flaviroseum]|uniref:Uncharacterized protein n=1 Tax=Sphaerisporangium flaviroseum TaxID=509199 RepID=A0ABP7J345_9ACTN
MVDVGSYELVWPTALFLAEGQRVALSSGSSWSDRVKWLLTEALSGATAVADFEDAAYDVDGDPWALPTGQLTTMTNHQRDWFTELLRRADELRQASAPRAYWPQRRVGSSAHTESPLRDAHRDFTQIIATFESNGYLIEAFGQPCVDSDEELPDPADVIEHRLGIGGLWPLVPADWNEDTFYGLVEVFHDMVSRPRRRENHPFGACGWHYYEFHVVPGQILYRWKINQMLRSAGVEYELAAEGEDRGRLIAVTDDARSHLVHQVLQTSTPGIKERVDHAIALFRNRSASPESKRSAIVTLAGVLEERRQLIRDNLGKPDEGSLFEIANRYDLRHRRTDQLGDYDPVFLDWIFWWYLATVELTSRLIAREGFPQEKKD